jgi:hypothetical protein
VINLTQRPLPDNTQHSKETDIHAPAGFEPAIPASEQPQTKALDGTTTGIGSKMKNAKKYMHPGGLPTPDRYLQAADISQPYISFINICFLQLFVIIFTNGFFFLAKQNYFSRLLIRVDLSV